jgi:hypothetical protein
MQSTLFLKTTTSPTNESSPTSNTSFQYRLQNLKYYQLYQNLLFSIQTLQTKIYIVVPYKEGDVDHL